ncbi:rhomboid family intramembrane serine protease [Holdemania filiformis]|uniref:rhomboid family intramembrane serine protease n=1 Tax=Holdemania filiformis TaxID=61171 RepID=UPI00266FAE8E|nr:rhomboid family intramembrane serine protease [Holdemania filiformis]
MNCTEKDVQLLQLAYYFISDCQYQFISLREAQDEIWLGNPKHPEYPVIRLSQTRLSTVFFDKTRILKIHQSIRNLFRRNCDLLDIHISDEAVQDQEEQIDLVTISPQTVSDPQLTAVFPGLDHAVQPIQDPQQEYNKITQKLAELQRQRAQSPQAKSPLAPPKATMILMGICLVIYLLSVVFSWMFRELGGSGEVSVSVAILLGGYYKAFVVGAHEYWRWLTSAFVHVDLWHLLMNMMALYNMGMLCEKLMGVRNYLIILFGSILFGSAFVFLGSGNVVAMGISGGLYGLLAAFLVYGIQTRILFQPQLRTQFLLILISLMPGVSLAAHFGGFVGGLLISVVLTRNDSWAQLRKNTMVALCVAVAFLGLKTVQPQARELDTIYPGTDRMVVEMLKDLHLDFYGDHLSKKMVETYVGSSL